MRRLALASVLVVVGSVLLTSTASAQKPGVGGVQPLCQTGCGGGGGGNPPWVVLGAPSGTVYTQYPYIEIHFCRNTYPLDPSTADIKVNGVDVMASFSYATGDPGNLCGFTFSDNAYSTASSVALSPGPNTIYANVCDFGGPAEEDDEREGPYGEAVLCGSQTWTITYIGLVTPTGPVVARDLCLTIAVGPSAAYECGDLRIVHGLPSVRTLGRVRAPTLLYNSQHAHPFPSLNADVTLAANDRPDSIIAIARVNAGSGFAQRDRETWPGTQWGSAGQSSTRRVMTNFPAGDLATGVYPFQLEIDKWVTGTGYTAIRIDTGSLAIVNRYSSPFGAGWWLAGYEQLQGPSTGPILWMGGDGSVRRYVNAGAWGGKTWYVARQVDGPDTLSFDGTSYTRQLKGGGKVVFSSSGFHTQTVSRLGYNTVFTQDGSNRLATITMPPSGSGLTYSFSYGGPNGTLSSVTAPDTVTNNNRTTVITGTSIAGGAARIATITDPGSSASVQFAYGNGTYVAAVTGRTDRRGTTTTFTLGTGLKLVAASLPALAITRTFCPAEIRLWACGSGLTSPDSTYTIYDGPRTDSSDVMHFWLDSLGAVTQVRDPYNFVTTIARSDIRWPGLPTRVRSPNGRTIGATYDGRGNLASATDSSKYVTGVHATTSYAWDGIWDQLTQITAPTGEIVQFGVSTSNGNRLWVQDGRGSASQTSFGYVTSGSGAGLVDSITVPGGARSILAYSAVGNVASSTSPLGWTTFFDADRLGRPIVTRSPLGPNTNSGTFRKDTTAYDAMGRVIRTASVNTVDAQSLTVSNSYDAEGNLAQVVRSGYPTIPGGTLTNSWTFDAANRPTVAIATDGLADSTFYDPAGNVDTVKTRRGQLITMTYDRLNRLHRRLLPTVTYDSITRGLSGTFFGNTIPYPWFPNSGAAYQIAGVTDTFAYDLAGNLVAADNDDARVRRGYFNDGQVRWDSSFIRTITGSDFTKHKYGLSYAYDLSGRLTVLRHPQQLIRHSSTEADSVRYIYDGTTGELKDVYDLQNNHFAFLYTLRGELARKSLPGNVFDTLSYDLDGRLTLDRIWHTNALTGNFFPYTVIRDNSFDYQDPIRVFHAKNVAGWLDTTTTTYDGLGHVASLAYAQHALTLPGADYRSWNSETDWSDALGNIYQSSSQSNISIGTSYTSQTPIPRNMYFTSAGRQAKIVDPNTRIDSMAYNASGDLEFVFTIPNSNPTWNNPAWYENRASFYDAAGRMRAAEWRYAQWTRGGSITEGSTWQMSFEDFRYDALGRRVLVRERRASDVLGWAYPMPATLSKVRRAVWDGQRELWEIQMPGRFQDSSAGIWENDTLPVAPEPSPQVADGVQSLYYFDPHPRYGRVGYVYAGPIDQPVSITKLGSTDFAYPNSQVYTFTTPFTIVPHWNWRGQADYGLFADGTYQRQEGSHWIKTAWRHRAFSLAQGQGTVGDAYGQTYTWLGSLVNDNENATWTLYRRNRYVDPLTGQFTQEDPAGLAGGANLYGFGGGDAVNFSDPFGLCKDKSGKELPADQCRDVTAHEGHAIFRGAANQGQWTYTEGIHEGEPDKDQDNKVGDCTDLVEASMRAGGAPATDWDERPATGQFAGSTNYRGLGAGEQARQGDVVVYAGHAGVTNGRRGRDGSIRAWQNGLHGTGWMWFSRDAEVYRRKVPLSP